MRIFYVAPLALMMLLWACGEDSDGGGSQTGQDTVSDTGGADVPVSADTGSVDDGGGTADLGTVDVGGPDDTGSDPDLADSGGDPDIQQPPITGPQPLGGPCGPTPTCWVETTDEEGNVIENPDWPSCLGEQCLSGVCTMPVCTKSCETDEQCTAAYNGPMGTEYRCAVTSKTLSGKEIKRCVPGTALNACTSDDDCAFGESCQFQFINNTWGYVCMTSVKKGQLPGQSCNLDPTVGDVTFCANRQCYNFGCAAACDPGVEQPCGPDPYLECQPVQLSDDPVTFDTCFPKQCGTNADCAEFDDTICRVFVADEVSVKEKEKYWANMCWKADSSAAQPGEMCEAGTEEPELMCVNPALCFGDTCTTLCESDVDCPQGAFACGVVEFNVDGYDFEFPLDVCLPFEGSQAPCETDSQCSDGEICKAFLASGDTAFEYNPAHRCGASESGTGKTGEPCNADNPCQGDFCLGGNEEENGTCSALCTQQSDCPTGKDAEGATLNGYCQALRYASVGTATLLDDLFLPLCVYDTGSASTCTKNADCSGGEVCQPTFVQSLPTETAEISWICLSENEDGTVETGDACSSGNDCKSGLCALNDAGTQGYCTVYCPTGQADECPNGGNGYSCVDWTLLERPTQESSVVVKRCEKL